MIWWLFSLRSLRNHLCALSVFFDAMLIRKARYVLLVQALKSFNPLYKSSPIKYIHMSMQGKALIEYGSKNE